MHLVYGEKEIAHLKKRDRLLGAAIERIGYLEREADADLFSSVVRHIIGQQISMAAQATVWRRIQEELGGVSAGRVAAASAAQLQALGMTHKKAGYILELAEKVQSGALDLDALHGKSDAEVVAELSSLSGIGVWTAEMLLTFCMRRPDILSWGDLAIHRGMRMLYRHRSIDKKRFEALRRRYSPCGTVASLYLWAIAAGALPELTDPAPRKKLIKKITMKKEEQT